MKKTFLILFFSILFCEVTFSQAVTYRDFQDNTNTYEARDTFEEIRVADDFGPRDLGDDWHGGVDFNSASDFGDMLLAPEAGTFVDVNRLIRDTERDIRYQILDVGEYRYVFLHMFDKHQNQQWYNDSTIYMNYCIPPNQTKWGMIMLIDNDTIAIGQFDNAQIVFNNDTLTVTNSVDQYDAIGLLGNSGQYLSGGVWVDYDSHLHLHTLPDNQTFGGDAHNRNPCQYVHYADTTYDISIWSELNSDRVQIKYPGISSTKIAVRTQLEGGQLARKRYSHIMDVNKVMLKMKEINQSSFEKIEGIGEESVISLGARIGESIVNHRINDNYPGTIHQWTQTGVNSNAYNGDMTGPNAKNPWDDYFFTDFITRIHKDDPGDKDTTATMIANCPQDARYNDGKYLLYAEVVDVKDSIQNSDTLTFTLDNFKPYIKSIQIYIGGRLVYNQSWVCNGNNCIQPQSGPVFSTISYADLRLGMLVNIESSEPLDSIRLSVSDLGISDQGGIPLPGREFSEWIFNIPGDSLYTNLDSINIVGEGYNIQFQFDGWDCSQNELIQFEDNNFCVEVPTRNANGWNNPDNLSCGTDTIHSFFLNCGIDSLYAKEEKRSTSSSNIITLIGEDCYEGGVSWIITNASGPWMNNGSIDLIVDENLGIGTESYEWNNGAATQDISQLLPGEYCVTITDVFCCQHTDCIEVEEDCPESLFYYAEYVWACGDQNNGSFKVVPVEGTPPYAYNWSNGSNSATAENLGTGWHSVTVVDAIGCQQEGSLYLSRKRIQLHAELEPPCSKITNDGVIDLSINGNGRWPMTYQWSHGATSQDVSGLRAGQYCVTVTDADSCSQSACFELKAELEISIASIQNISLCEGGGDCGGAINLEVSNTDNYTILWNGPNGFSSSAEDINGLCTGQYNVTVTDAKGCTASTFAVICCCRAFESEPMTLNPHLCNFESGNNRALSVTGESLPAYRGNIGSVDIRVDGGLGAQYFYSWSGPDNYQNYTEDIYGLSPGEYCVTVTDGCNQVSACFDVLELGCGDNIDSTLLEEIFFSEMDLPCDGASNGSVKLVIPNPDDEEVTILLDGIIEIPISQFGHPTEALIGNLSSEETHSLKISIGDCIYEFEFKLDEEDSRLIYNYLERNLVCIYDAYCDGDSIGRVEEFAIYRYENGDDHPCKVPIFCRSQKIKDQRMSKRRVRGQRYRMIVQNMRAAGRLTDQYFENVIRPKLEDIRACDKVKYCPGTLKVIAHDRPAGNNGHPSEPPFINDQGCVEVICPGVTEDFVVCDLGVPELSVLGFPPSCPISLELNLHYLFVNYNEISLAESEFIGSDLAVFVLENGELPEAKCTYVRFCKDDFSIVYHNLDEAECKPLINNLEVTLNGVTTTIEHSCQSVFDPLLEIEIVFCLIECIDPTELECVQTLTVSHVFSGFPFDGENDLVKDIKVIDEWNGEEHIHNFGTIRNDDLLIPVGLVSTPDDTLYYDYAHRSTQPEKFPLSNAIHYLDDWDTGESILIESIEEDKKALLKFEDTLIYWTQEIIADSLLKITHLSKTADEIIVGGYFSGNLIYDDKVEAQSSLPSFFVLRILFDGSLFNVDRIENIDRDNSRFIVKADHKYLFVSKNKGNWVKVNSDNLNLGLSNGVFFLELDQNQHDLVGTIESTGPLELLGLKTNQSEERTTLAMLSSGPLYIGAETVEGNGNQSLFLLTFDEFGNLLWENSIESSNILSSKFALEYGNGDDIFIGITFVDTLNLYGDTIISKGASDITLVKLDGYGNVSFNESYGTQDTETISKLLFDQSILFFGGEFSGAGRERIIGEYRFINITDDQSKAYVSYISDNGSSGNENQKSVNKNRRPDSEIRNSFKKNDPPLKVFPNPAKEDFFIEVFDDDISHIIICDLLGNKVFFQETSSDEIIQARLKQFSSGVYLLKAFNHQGEMVHSENLIQIH